MGMDMLNCRRTNKGKQMKRSIISVIACVCALTAFADVTPTVSVTASLKDGSSVRGDFLSEGIAGATLFQKNIVLVPAIVRSVTLTSTNGEAKVELSNGDHFTMKIANDAFAVRSILGDLKIPRASLRAMSLSARSAAAKGGATGGLIFHCTFDDAASITSPAVGPAGTFMTGMFEDGKIGKALLAMPYKTHASFNIPAGFLNDAGCIEFWTKILKSSPQIGDRGDPRLFTFTFADTHTPACKIDLVSNDGGGNSGFATCSWFAGIASIRGMHGLHYGDLFTPQGWRDWHHFALVWDKDGISDIQGNPSVALVVDGKQIPNTVFNPCPLELLRMPSKTAYVLSFTYDPLSSAGENTKSPFLIDDFKIWDYAKTDIFQ